MIDINLPVLEKDHPWWIHYTKLEEEARELVIAMQVLERAERGESWMIPPNAAAELVAETLDVVQMCIGILDKVLEKYPWVLSEGTKAHIEKLYGRGWRFKKWIQIEED